MRKITFCIITLILCLFGINKAGYAQPQNKEAYYAAISSSNLEKINAQLDLLKSEVSSSKNEAYIGALLMKKAGIVFSPAEKLNLFKSGRNMLEQMIQKDKDNIEYRFLRVLIQENAPKFLKYQTDLDSDCTFIRNAFKNLPAPLQKIILDYNKHSKKLNIPES